MNNAFGKIKNIVGGAGVFLFFVVRVAGAQPSLEVSQIGFDNRYFAVVDGQKVKEGDVVEGLKVEDIGKDYVIFVSENGEYFLRELPHQAADNKISVVTENRKVPPKNGQETGLQGSREIQQNIEQADGYVAEAARLLTNKQVISQAMYQKALGFYEKAEQALQYALEKTLDSFYQERLRTELAGLWDAKDRIYKEKAGLQESITKAIVNRQLVIGMTKSDVLKSWGKATQINYANYAGNREEQWVYGNSVETAKYLYFDGDILTSMQY